MKSTAMLGPGIRLIWFDVRPGVRIATFRDSKCALMMLPTDYCIDIERSQSEALCTHAAIKSAIEAATYALLDLYRYLHEEKRSLAQLNDSQLAKFRNWAFFRVRDQLRSRGTRSAQRTVNVKLRNVYQYIDWCQRGSHLPPNTIGPENCKIRSTLTEISKPGTEFEATDRMKYPMLFRRTGERTRTGIPQHWATNREIEAIERRFHEIADPDVASRNALILRIAQQMGWRRESILSLTVDLFDEKLFSEAEELDAPGYDITPPTQKFGYTVGFSMPWALAYAIKKYIDTDRVVITKRCNASENETQDRIFLNTRTGAPLTLRAVSNLFGSAFKAAGAPKGTATHSLRRYAGDNEAREEIDFRVRHGLSTAREDVAEAIAAKLGQSSTTAVRYYVKATADMKRNSVSEVHADELARAYATIAELRSRIAELERSPR